MREIKFRAWDKEEKRTINFEELIERNIMLDYLDEYIAVFQELIGGYGSPRIYMQYTGLKDKNGKEIYEGDIVEAWSEGFKHIGEVRKRVDGLYIMYPAYRNGYWGLKPNNAGETTVEVIGNIYENPELLEG